MTKKRGQADASNAAALVALIAALIVLYIMFLPPDIRYDLLQGNDSGSGSNASSSAKAYNRTLLDVVPGKLSYVSAAKETHLIPNFRLYKTTSASVLKAENPFYVKKGWFDEKRKVVTFSIADLQNTNNALLSFTASQYKGTLIIKLNGAEIYNSEITKANPDPIILPKEILTQDNQLEFYADSVGIAFWRTNEFNIVNAKIIADVTDVSKQQSRNIFIVSSTESYNLEQVSLEFNPNCNYGAVGTLEVFMNSVNVFSGVPDCGRINVIQGISTGVMRSGENNIVFKTGEGSYLVDQIKIVSKLRDEPSLVEYFELTDKQYKDILDGSRKLNLTMEFVDRGFDIEADIIINGHKTAIPYGTRDSYFKQIPKEWLREDSNYINIQPKETFDAARLLIELADN